MTVNEIYSAFFDEFDYFFIENFSMHCFLENSNCGADGQG